MHYEVQLISHINRVSVFHSDEQCRYRRLGVAAVSLISCHGSIQVPGTTNLISHKIEGRRGRKVKREDDDERGRGERVGERKDGGTDGSLKLLLVLSAAIVVYRSQTQHNQ